MVANISDAVGEIIVGRRKRNRSPVAGWPEKKRSWLRRHAFWLGLGLFAVATITAAHYLPGLIGHQRSSTAAGPGTPEPIAPTAQKAFSLDKLLAMTPDELAGMDIAEMNLLCATGLKGSEGLDVAKCMSRLDDYAKWVRYYTQPSLRDFHQRPQDFKNSEAKFRVLLLISVLQKEYGIHYNDRGENSCDCSNSKNPFIHGMIDDPNGGTCASMPVMYVAVGRRLGYPVSLVLAKTHIFARWDDLTTGEKFNIEGTNARFSDHPDSHYQNWPYKITDAELKQGWYLKPLTPAEELAVFLQNRGYCLMDNARYAEAEVAFTESYRLAPQNPLGRAQIASAAAGGRPLHAPVPRIVRGRGLVDEFGVPSVYPGNMADIEQINAFNRANRQRMMPPPTGMQQPPYGPANPYGPQQPQPPGMP